MRQVFIVASLLFFATAGTSAQAEPACPSGLVPPPSLLGVTELPPASAELAPISNDTSLRDGVFVYSANRGQSVDRVLARMRAQSCRPAAATTAYVPKTKWDNTPYRYNAGGNGRKFTADDFDAWMKANGIHVSKGAPQPAPAPNPNINPAPDPGFSAPPVK